MKLAILFWFYKDAALSEDRLRTLRLHNPTASIYGLYGGEPADADAMRARLGRYLDDWYVFPEPAESRWKWRHGDLVINRWFRDRGRSLDWDTVFVAQWDMLVLDSLANLFPNLKADELLLSGLRPIREVEPWWWWITGPERRGEYDAFRASVERSGARFPEEPLCCQFIVACLPRKFLDRYAGAPDPELGFLEYRVPVYAQIHGFGFCNDHPYRPWWQDDPAMRRAPLREKALNADTFEVPLRCVASHLGSAQGLRIFHPFLKRYPSGALAFRFCLAKEILLDKLRPRLKRLRRAGALRV